MATHTLLAYAPSNRKIDPSRRRATGLKPDGSPDDNDRVETGPTQLAFDEWAALGLTPPNLTSMRAYRLERLREQLRLRDYGGLVLFDPLNIRYATDSTNMQLWTTHNPARACFVGVEGPVVLWDFHSCEHLTAHLPLITEVRHGASFFYFESAEFGDAHAAHFAGEVAELMRIAAGDNKRLAIDKMELAGVRAFEALGFDLKIGQQITELARVIKSAEEINAMRCAMAACEAACAEMREAMTPEAVRAGLTEVDLWAEMQKGNHIRGGEWIETRIMSSGPRTNPWFQECGPRVIGMGEMLAFDTDLIGPYGYCADISRTWLIGGEDPSVTATDEQRRLYRVAYDHIVENMQLLKPGAPFRDLTFEGHQLPEEFRAQRYGVRFHGVGLCDEYPSIRYAEDFEPYFPKDDWEAYGVLQPGMTLCVEAYVGAVGGVEGVKLEDQVLITETGHENLTRCPHDPYLLPL